MSTQSPETPPVVETTAPVKRQRTPRPPVGEVLKTLNWPLLLLIGVVAGVLWVIMITQSSATQLLAGLLPVTGGIIVGRRAKVHINWHAFFLSVITAISAALATAVVFQLDFVIAPEVRSALLTSYVLLVPFPAFGVITAARSEARAREVREAQGKRGGKLEKPGRVKTLDDLRGLSLPQLGGYVSDLFRRHGFTIPDYRFESKENYIELDMRKDDESWLVRVMVEEKIKHGVALQFYQQMREQPGVKAILVTSMDFQDQALRWAKEKPIALIDGPTLMGMAD